MKIRYRAEALSDIDEIFQFLQEPSSDGAQNVLRAVYAGIRLVGVRPWLAREPTIRKFE
jgi:plasmid stabilization system protein ParE